MRRISITVCLTVCVVLLWMAHDASASASSSVERKIRQAFGRHADRALRVARCESNLRPWAVSHTLDVGVFQINYAAHHQRGESFEQFRRRFSDLDTNIAYALRLSRGGTNWGPWTCGWAA